MSNEQKERGLLSNFAKRIEQLAFEMPAPNPYTPQFVMLAQSLDAYARTHESKAVGLDVEAIIKAAITEHREGDPQTFDSNWTVEAHIVKRLASAGYLNLKEGL